MPVEVHTAAPEASTKLTGFDRGDPTHIVTEAVDTFQAQASANGVSLVAEIVRADRGLRSGAHSASTSPSASSKDMADESGRKAESAKAAKEASTAPVLPVRPTVSLLITSNESAAVRSKLRSSSLLVGIRRPHQVQPLDRSDSQRERVGREIAELRAQVRVVSLDRNTSAELA